MDKKEMIEKLKALQELTDELVKYGDYYESGCAEITADKILAIQAQLGKLPGIPSVVNAMPVFPEGEEEYNTAKQETAQSATYNTVAMAATAGLVILMFCVPKTITVMLAGVSGVVWYLVGKTHKLNKQGLKKKEQAYQESLRQHASSMKAFRQALAGYDAEAKNGMEAAKAFGQCYREKRGEIFNELEQYQSLKDAALTRCTELIEQINAHDYITEDYFHHIPKLITLLQSGRADTYKEALNLAIEEERQDAIEAARQEEELRRLEALERQAEEERRHNMMMERQEAAHQRAMERQAQAQVEEQRRANVQAERDRRKAEQEAFHQRTKAEEEARKKENATRMAGVSKCANCANSKRCPSHIKNSGAGLTCGGYTPY